MMTETEAREKWCPFVRNEGVDGKRAAGNRNMAQLGDNPTWSRCIGARCMAWRWLPSGDTRAKIEAIKAHRNEHGSSLIEAKDAVEKDWRPAATEGYCGLAGRPGG